MSKVIKLVLGATFISQVAMAQTPSGGAPPAAPPTTPAAEITANKTADLTPQEMLTQSQTYRGNIMQTTQRLEQMVDESRKQKDVIRLTCVTDKSTEAKVGLNIVDKAIVALQGAAAANEKDAANHEFTRITIVNQKVQILGAEAEGCVGEELQFVGATKVDVEIGPDVRKDDPTQPSGAKDLYERPPVASPFM